MTSSSDRIFLSPPHIGERERALVNEAMDSGYVAPAGPMLDRFEREFSAYVGQPHAVAVSSGTAALHLALRILGVGPGDAVIVPSLTFIGGVAAIFYQGATPIFVDCDPVTWGLDPQLLDEAYRAAESQGLKVKAVMPTDLYGQVCDIDPIIAFCAEKGVPLLMDSAEAVGALHRGRHSGFGAYAAAFSFNGNKILTTSGGGMLTSSDPAFIDRARYLSTAARQPAPHYEHTEVGYNYRLSNISAAIGIAQLENIEERVARRRAIFDRYRARLEDAGLTFAPEGPERRHTRWLTVGLLKSVEPERLRLALEESNIEARRLWKPMHRQPVFQGAAMIGGEVCDDLFARGVCLPSGSSMTDGQVDRVCEAVEAALSRAV